ncbi:unnamed protein product [Paramecium octaurelia]|uniref:PUM-HD domain-containing protein n=1 Tax=Paramecium octaurelia TaxID=43137 RepID=A0A8S1TBV8_PAROT|nr:unnamed protein product [Paramecium octaurelia]
MSNPIPIEINSDADEFQNCFPSNTGSTAPQSLYDNSNIFKILPSQQFVDQLEQVDDEFDLLNQEMKNELQIDNFKPSLLEAFQVDMSSYITHEKLTKNSRRMQYEYENAKPKEREYVFQTFILNYIVNLSLDKYMHYILEKIIEVGPPKYRNIILDQIFNSINKLITDLYACKVMQKGLEIMAQFPQDSQNQFQKYLNFIIEDNNFMKKLYTHKIANQIFQKSLEVFDGKSLHSLLLNLDKYILNINQKQIELSTDQYGCLIVNKIIEILPKQIDQNSKQVANSIIMRAIENSSCLVRRQYANYIIQQILERGQECHKRKLLDENLIKDFVSMSMDKYGSNVAEKAIIYSGPQWRQKLWEEEVAVSEESFRKLVNDQFANYPIQRLYEYLTQEYRNEFFGYLQKLHESNFLNHHGQIVWKFALVNLNINRFAQRANKNLNPQISSFQERNIQISQQQLNQQFSTNNQYQQYQSFLQQQQYQQQQQQLMYNYWVQQQQNPSQQPFDYQQYQAFLMQNTMLVQQSQQMYPQPQQFYPNYQNLQQNNSQIMQTLKMVQNQSD